MNPTLRSHSRAEVEKVLRCVPDSPRPLFMPAIYEHKGWFIGETPSAVSRDADLLYRAMMAEYAALEPDALAVGVDVYNVEAEAVGCEVTFYEDDDSSIPGIKPTSHIITTGTDLSSAPIPNPLRDGRMPVNIGAAQKVVKAFNGELWVRGAVSGPFSLAISLMGAEALFINCLDDPDFVHALMQYSSKIIKTFGKAYVDVGAELILFDSQASPELLSPDMYEEFVLPVMKDITAYFKGLGVGDIPLVIGGNTTPIADALIQTGCNNLLCDFTGDWSVWSEKCREAKLALRRNISPHLLQKSNPDVIFEKSKDMVGDGRDLPGFIMGTAVIPYGTPTENILAVKAACSK